MADKAALPLALSVPASLDAGEADFAAVFEAKAAPIDHGGDAAFALRLQRAIGGVGRVRRMPAREMTRRMPGAQRCNAMPDRS